MLSLPRDSKIVVRLPNALGDAIMASASLRRLAKYFDPKNITLVGLPATLQVLSGSTDFASTITYDRKGKDKGIKGFLGVVGKVRELRADLAVIFPNSWSTALMFAMARVPHRLGYFKEGRRLLLTAGRARDKDASGGFAPKYTGRYFLELLDLIEGLPDEDPHPSLAIDERGEEEFQLWAEASNFDRQRPLLILVPGAAFGPSKIWIPERYAEVADRLAEERNTQVLVSYGPGEESIAESVKATLRTTPLPDAKLTLRGLKSLYQRATFVLCNDTGPRHLAVAFNIPNVTIMGPNNPAYTHLESERGEVVREDVECSPCQLKVCPLKEQVCMTQLSAQRVFERSIANWPQ
ncbi:MAG: lipopolysaccharide heptosyltransferase II [Planctomycetes bacterium]|nr:lipopolysaccharide heptosyltransferase II [Planctomycetota bacterium]